MSRAELRRERIDITLRSDILQALREVAEEEEMSVSMLIEAVLAFNLRLTDIVQNLDTIRSLPRKVRRRLQGREL